MKKQPSKKFYAFIILMMFSLTVVNAQIVYTDVNPDSTIISSTGIYNLDLNNDGNTDFQLSNLITIPATAAFCGSTGVCHCTGYHPPVIKEQLSAMSSNKFKNTPSALNTKIDSLVIWYSSASYYLAANAYGCHCSQAPQCLGSWTHTITGAGNDQYFALTFFSGVNKYYGWVRLDLNPASNNFTIKDYAYNSISNQPILAGETNCTIPTVNLTQSGSLSFCNGDSVTLTANGTGYQYQWKKNNVNIAGATKQTYAAKTAGVYKCKVTNSCGSKTSGTKTVTVPCRMNNENFVETLEHLSVYPNPATNSVTIKFPSDEAGEIQIVNLFGQIAYSKNLQGFQNLEGLNETTIDISKFPAGMYVVRWSSGENNETKTFSVVK